MLLSKEPAARFTLLLTILGVLLSPLDWLCSFFERQQKTRSTTQPCGPHIFVCGPARSGTTLVYQVLANTLPLAYPRNFTALFSRSSLLASRLFTHSKTNKLRQRVDNYYGKTAGMQSPCEANHLWNQWVEPDESSFRTRLLPDGAQKMSSFFNSFSIQSGLPTLTKNNNANAFADVIATQLDNAYFICLRRDKRYLAQSLIKARREINGDINQSYGVIDTNSDPDKSDPVSQIVDQVIYLDALAEEQQRKIGSKHFWIVDYESFCATPSKLIERIRVEILQQNDRKNNKDKIATIVCNNRITDPVLFNQLERRFEEQNALTKNTIKPKVNAPVSRSVEAVSEEG